MKEPLSEAEVLRWLRMVKRDRWYREQCPVPHKGEGGLGAAAGLSYKTLLYAEKGIHGGVGGITRPGISQLTIDKLSVAIDAIEDGRLVFSGRGKHTPSTLYWLEPPVPRPAPQSPTIEDSRWDYWAECCTCWGRKWLPVRHGRRPEIWCYTCNPPSRWAKGVTTPRLVRLVDRILTGVPSPHDQAQHPGSGRPRPNHLALLEPTLRKHILGDRRKSRVPEMPRRSR